MAKKSQTPPLEIMPHLIAGALARRDIAGAIRLLESEKDHGAFSSLNDTFLLAYRYCLNGSVERAETLVVASAAAIKKDWFVDWLSGKNWKTISDFILRTKSDAQAARLERVKCETCRL